MRLFRIFIRLVAAAVAAMLFSSCVSREAGRIMDSAEDVMWTKPDSALAALESIDTLDIKTKAQRARYSLLYTMALNRNWIDTTDLHVIQPAANYYERHGSKDDKMKMYYYWGVIQFNRGELLSAIGSFIRSKELSESSEDYVFRGLILSAISDVYARNNNYLENISYSKEAIRNFEKAGDSLRVWITMGSLAFYYAENNDWEKSDSLYAKFFSMQCRDSSVLAQQLVNKAAICLRKPEADPRQSVELFTKAVNEMGWQLGLSDYCVYAYALDLLGYETASDRIFSQLDSISNNPAVLYVWKYRISKRRGDNEKALDFLEKTVAIQDFIVVSTVNQSVALAQSDYFQSKSRLLERENRIRKLDIWIIILIGVIAGFVVLTVYLQQKRKWLLRLEEMVSINNDVNYRLSEERMTNDKYREKVRQLEREKETVRSELSNMQITSMEAEQKLSLMTERIEKLTKNEHNIQRLRQEYALTYKRQFAKLKDLCSIYLELPESDKKKERIYSKVKDLSSVVYDCNQKKLESMINENMNDLMTKFRKDMPSATESDFRFIALWILGFDAKTIARVMGYTSSSVYTKRCRLKEKISAISSENKEIYLMSID